MTEPLRAVFLSYASQDALPAQTICEALRSSGIEVWFDRSELRGGDSWDQKIRREIRDCALFIPIISRNTQARLEGYFRREWKLAIERTHDMAEQKAFLVPVVLDDTGERDAMVPDAFRAVQWTSLPAGATPPAFVERIKGLISPDGSPARARGALSDNLGAAAPSPAAATSAAHRAPSARSRYLWPILAGVALLGVLAYLAATKLGSPKPAPTDAAAPVPTATPAFAPPAHAIAVIPFVNMSGDKDQEYFSDGLSEELLNSLSRINELQVAARTSSFYFKGEHVDLATIAHKLNVASILEGSVRRSGQTLRITAQLTNTVTGFQLWSETYDRNMKDVLQLQTEIANAVASALKIALLGGAAEKVQIGSTRNPAAFDAYLLASKAYRGGLDENGLRAAISAYTEAIRLDPDYAAAYADRSVARLDLARNFTRGANTAAYTRDAETDARKAIAAAPDLADGHLALAVVLEQRLDFKAASQEYERSRSLAPGNAKVLRHYGAFEVEMGHTEAGLSALRRSVVLDPLNTFNQTALLQGLAMIARTDEAARVFKELQTLDPSDESILPWLGYSYYQKGDYAAARDICESVKNEADFNRKHCLSMTYFKLGRRADAEAMERQVEADAGGVDALLAMTFAQWGDNARAIDSLEKALRERDPYLVYVKVHTFLDPIRNEPRFQAIVRQLNFPD